MLETFIALLLLFLLLPLFFVLVTICWIETGTPFFIQQRLGKFKRPFHLIKFRTLKRQASAHPIDDDLSEYLTFFGGFLRKSKLDELPQLFNVLKGEMSFVGPRPCLPTQQELIKERDSRCVFSVRPGITGVAQIKHVDMSTPMKLARYDAIWVKKKSLSLYLYCIWSTLKGQGSGDKIQKELK